jgi:hypothetical protein
MLQFQGFHNTAAFYPNYQVGDVGALGALLRVLKINLKLNLKPYFG